MVFIPKKYLATDEQSVPEGTNHILTCDICGSKFAIPETELTKELAESTVCDDPACIEKYNQIAAANAVADLKAGAQQAAADTIAKALGN
jgi:ribosome-binding protein aMBF1 (putative translation factor)